MEKRILLICGSGASSGFLAANIRKEIVKRSLEYDVAARSEADIMSNLDETVCIMVGPHLKAIFPEVADKVSGTDIKIALMEKSYYSMLDGKGALDHILRIIEG